MVRMYWYYADTDIDYDTRVRVLLDRKAVVSRDGKATTIPVY